MVDQIGFNFGSSEPDLQEQEDGGWNDPQFTFQQYAAMFAKAEDTLQLLGGLARALADRGLAEAREQHKCMQECPRDDGSAYDLWRSRFELSDQEANDFVKHCEAMSRIATAGMEFKVRRGHDGHVYAGMYVAGLGSVIVRRWASDNIGADFHLFRSPFFLASYRDSQAAYHVPDSVWEKAYCAEKLASSNDGIANVPTFTYCGREFINDGGWGRGDYRECEGWTFRPIADWNGPTYTYKTQCRAWDEGRLERGDRRGLVVSVRGTRCVMDGAALFYDTNPRNGASSANDVEDTLPEGDEDELDLDLEEHDG